MDLKQVDMNAIKTLILTYLNQKYYVHIQMSLHIIYNFITNYLLYILSIIEFILNFLYLLFKSLIKMNRI